MLNKMIKVQQTDCPVRFITDDCGHLIEAQSGFFMGDNAIIEGKIRLDFGWTPQMLRYVADTLEEARANGGKSVMGIKGNL